MADSLYEHGIGESAASIEPGNEALSESAAAPADIVQLAQAGAQPLVLTKPPAGQLSGPHNVVPGQDIVTDFPTEIADVSMDGPRLIITFADGARIEVANFGAIDPIPNVILEDGTILAGGVVVAQLGAVEQALDFEDVGAGPELPGGGVSAYSDDHGTVIGMLTPEGTLPLTAFGPAAAAVEEPHEEILPTEADAPIAADAAGIVVEDELQGGTLLDPASVTGPDPLNTSVSGTLNISGGTITGLGYNGALGSATQAGLTWAANDGSWTMTITNAASGAFTFTLLGPLDHHLAGLVFGDDTLTGLFAATITGEGGTITRDITITVNDDGPTVTSNATVQLDDDALSGGNPGGVGDDPDAVNVTGTLGHSFGADGGSIAYLTSGAPQGFSYQISGSSLLVIQGETTVLTLTLNTATGAYTVTQNAPISHEAGAAENNQSFTIAYRVTDGDGDTVDGTLAIDVDDDIPINNEVELTKTVHEDALSNAQGVGNPEGGQTTIAVFTAAELATLVSVGADEPVTIKLNGAIDGTDTGLNSKGGDVLYDVVSATQINGVVGERIVFTLIESPAGTFTFTLVDQIDHLPLAVAGTDAETTVLSLASVFVATDFDGDSVVIAAGASVTIENDVPINNEVVLTTKLVHEDALNNAQGVGNPEGGQTTIAVFTAAELATLVSVGADEPLTIKLNGAIDGTDTGLNSKGGDVLYDVVSATQINGVVGERIVFTLIESPAGTFTFTLVDQIDHLPLATGGGDAETTVLGLASVFVATDFDGDSVVINAGASVTIENDVPILTSAQHGFVANTAWTEVIGDIVASVGADEPGSFSLLGNATTTPLDTNGKPVIAEGQAVHYYVDPSNPNLLIAFYDVGTDNDTYEDGVDQQVFTLQINADGTYTYTLIKPIDAIETIDIGSSTSFGAGPSQFQVLNDATGNLHLALLSSDDGGVNGSVAGWGVGSNNLDTGQDIRVDFGGISGLDPSVAYAGLSPLSENDFPNVSFATVELLKYSNGNQITYTVFYVDAAGTPTGDSGLQTITVTGTGNVDTLVTITAPSGLFIDYIDFTVVSGSGKFDLVDVGVTTNTGTTTLDFYLTITDFDGDSVTVPDLIEVTTDGTPATITGTTGSDSLAGDNTNNTLQGLAGDDTLTGGAGVDTFVFDLGLDEGTDTVTDLEAASDVLSFLDVFDGAGDDIADVDAMISSISNVDGHVAVNFDSGTTVEFANVAYAGQTSIGDLVNNASQILVDHS